MASSNDGSESYVVVEQAVGPETPTAAVTGGEVLENAKSEIVVTDESKQDSQRAESTPKTEDNAKDESAQEATKTVKEDGDEGGDGDEEEKDAVVVGMLCGSKDLYQKVDEWNNISWTTKYPDGLEEAAEDEDTARYALLVRNSKQSPSSNTRRATSDLQVNPCCREELRFSQEA